MKIKSWNKLGDTTKIQIHAHTKHQGVQHTRVPFSLYYVRSHELLSWSIPLEYYPSGLNLLLDFEHV